jgi:ribonuclease HII
MIELELIHSFPHYLIATDEVGRGPLGGPVVAAAIGVEVSSSEELKVLLSELKKLGVNDSKKLSALKRKRLLNELRLGGDEFKEKKEIQFLGKKIEFIIWDVTAEEIDQENILASSLRGMKEACEVLANLKELPMTVLIDGHMKFRGLKKHSWEEVPLIKGDSKSALIGLASIIAKEKRDRYMRDLHEIYPQYGFNLHFGYPTKMHREAIQEHGPCPFHRKTFKGVKEFLRP